MSPVDAAPIALSITRGGPFHRLMRRLRWVRFDRYDALRQSLAVVAVTWLPVQLFGLSEGTPAWDRMVWHGFSFHLRFLVAVPLLFTAEMLLEQRCQVAVAGFDGDAFGTDTTERVRRLARDTERLRDSAIAECLMIGMIVVTRLLIWRAIGPERLIRDYVGVEVSLASGAWRAFASLPIFNFLVLRWLWRWALWTHLLWCIARLRLRLVPSHPDGSGGIRRLAEPSYAMAIMLAAVSSVLAASWANEIVFEGAALGTFAIRAVVALVLGELLTLIPLVAFTSVLTRTRFDGLDQYHRFALAYTRGFHRRWIDEEKRDDLLGTPDISGLADLISSVQSVAAMCITPMRREHIVAVAVGVVLPMLPLPILASGLPFQDVVRRLLGIVFFGH